MEFDLPLIWFGIIIFATLMYIVMDGFDLGIGILFPFIHDEDDRDVMVNTVAPVWDGNETWLVLGGASLLGAFPLAYAIVLEALTIPLLIMLLALIFRGVAFEFRFKSSTETKPFWDNAFMFGSIIATFAQGVVLGAFISGISVDGQRFSGSSFDWLSPFSLFCGFGLMLAYALLGATWLVKKCTSTLKTTMQQLAKVLAICLLMTIGIVSLWTPFVQPNIALRWFSLPNLFYFAPVPLLVLLCTKALIRALNTEDDYRPFLLTLALIFLGFSGLGISIWPHIIPPTISLWQAAAPESSLGFMLIGALMIIPLILAYTFWSYYVFRGKVTKDAGYH
ncbi:cytochrome d ubiquinol oxidase subunit II [Shewanella mangrovisoli]|uniref:cytochrome d ubiquinol oxidase subunit II n=1 Tax=Shewanella mangrovisoli TaxID=2864211 RepID=UPI0035B9F751